MELSLKNVVGHKHAHKMLCLGKTQQSKTIKTNTTTNNKKHTLINNLSV